MGYRHINNLYKDQTVLMFKRLYAMEKIHGTSAHIAITPIKIVQIDGLIDLKLSEINVTYFSGGEKHENFIKLFDTNILLERYGKLGIPAQITIYGEAYGGKQQGMSETYGKELKFVAFEVQIGDRFMKVPYAKEICDKLRIEFVHYEEIDADPELIDKLANAPSVQAQRNGVENPKLPREGVVLRPLVEFLHPDGVGRIMAKHKNDIYKEREHAPKLQNPEDLKILEDAKAIAQEWVTPMRLVHVMDKAKANGFVIEEKLMNYLISLMVEDVEREAKGEIISNKQTRKAISQRTAKLVIEHLKGQIK
jgi:hypothetical protein